MLKGTYRSEKFSTRNDWKVLYYERNASCERFKKHGSTVIQTGICQSNTQLKLCQLNTSEQNDYIYLIFDFRDTTNTTGNRCTETQLNFLLLSTTKKRYNIPFRSIFQIKILILKRQWQSVEYATVRRRVLGSSLGYSLLSSTEFEEVVRVVKGSEKECRSLWNNTC